MRYQLSLDSCTKACSVALTPLDGGKAFAWFEILDRGHAEIIAHQAQLLMLVAGIKAQDISQIAVTIGPGTFTGARIALAFARMFAAARDIPIIAVNSLEAIAFNAISNLSLSRNDIVYTAIDARRGQVYFASYDSTGAEIFTPEAIEIRIAAEMIKSNSLILGTGRELLIEAVESFSELHKLSPDMHFPQAEIFGDRVKNRVAETTPVSPLYLRAADAKLPASHPITFTQ
ncbi:MAG: tRNA (adenosine(37)-N6)-threonylcarbamoyltransferase complex dimerization subunit type 1 TsaB [Hyphomicrobiales bacterium]|nr:MAG: tRNA (adenosine(37)-N6)-threonylcarbamoyltransferase complex dimerization subunit type 1 TsaB [Hyphomicrobiales bacterium]